MVQHSDEGLFSCDSKALFEFDKLPPRVSVTMFVGICSNPSFYLGVGDNKQVFRNVNKIISNVVTHKQVTAFCWTLDQISTHANKLRRVFII